MRDLFSPGPVNADINIQIDFHHRSEQFHNLYEEKCNLIRDTFFNNDYDVILTQGSGTSAIETAVSGLTSHREILILSNGTFSERIVDMCSRVSREAFITIVSTESEALAKLKTDEYEVFICVCFETSISRKNKITDLIDECAKRNIISIVDMVSALGYYAPTNASVVCSSSAKILRGLPALGILAYRKEIDGIIDGTNGFYLNFRRYIDSKKNRETPHTTMLPQIMSIDKTKFFNPDKINQNCEAIQSNPLFEFIGERYAPVLTLQFKNAEVMQSILQKIEERNINIYYNAVYMKDKFQIGMFNHDVKKYELLNDIIKSACDLKY